MDIAIIGGGAAGFFAAIAVKENYPQSRVVILEKSQKFLSKVRISGGGRCNVTNGCSDVGVLLKAYPRGGKRLRKALHVFNTSDTMRWFESRGVPLMIQDDQCVFPVSQSSQSIIDCFMDAIRRLEIDLELGTGVSGMRCVGEQIVLDFTKPNLESRNFEKVIIATGGSPKRSGFEWLEKLGHKIEDPVPSLFTFNMPSESITDLMGIVVEKTLVSIQGSKIKSDGPLLITHWGMSGPAILKLSAFGARYLSERNYDFNVQVNWVNETNTRAVLAILEEIHLSYPRKKLSNIRPYLLPERLWLYLLEKIGLSPDRQWIDIGSKSLNRLVNVFTNDTYHVQGKTTFKEEFVTCGGVSLDSIDMDTMQSKVCPNLYFAGEVMDIDAITGGYNFQAAWSTAFIAGKLG